MEWKERNNKIEAIFAGGFPGGGSTLIDIIKGPPKLTRTKVFILRYFLHWEYADIARRFDMDVETVRKTYSDACQRIAQAMRVLDDRQAVNDHAEYALKANEEATGKLNKSEKWWILNKVLGLTTGEIAKMYDSKSNIVTNKIKYVSDRVMAGEHTFLSPNREQIRQAQQRLEAKKARDRKRREKAKKAA
jgi:hypothetical protein